MMSRRSDLAAATDELKGTANSSRESRTPEFYKVAKKANSRSKESVLKSLIMRHVPPHLPLLLRAAWELRHNISVELSNQSRSEQETRR